MEQITIQEHPYCKCIYDIANILALKSRIGNTDKDKMLPIPTDLEGAATITIRHILNTVRQQAKVGYTIQGGQCMPATRLMAFAGLVSYYITNIIESEGFENRYPTIMTKISGVLMAELPASVFQDVMNSGASLYMQMYQERENKGKIQEYHAKLEDLIRYYLISGEDKYLNEFAPLFKALPQITAH